MKDEKEFEFDDDVEFDFGTDSSDEHMSFIDAVKVNMEDNFIEIHHTIDGKTLTLRYCGRLEGITLLGGYTADTFAVTYPQIDARVISAIASVFVDLRYYGHDFYSGDFEAALKYWLERFVFNDFERKDVDLVKYIIEKETKSLLRDLSKTRLHKCWNNDQFTPLIWASPEQIKKQYDHYLHFGRYDKHEEQ